MKVARAFGFPFRPGARAAWLTGVPLVLLFPVSFVVLFGYAVRVMRTAAADIDAPPPGFGVDRRLLRDGVLVSLAAALFLMPYAAAAGLLGGWLRHRPPFALDPILGPPEAYLAAALLLFLPWGIVLLVLAPPALAAYAGSGRAADLFDAPAAVRMVAGRFADWNLACVGVVTGWLLALASAGACCIGFLPGAFYAILVSAHAIGSLVEAHSATPGAPPAPAR